jgi:hypothetical protein
VAPSILLRVREGEEERSREERRGEEEEEKEEKGESRVAEKQ